MKVTVLVPIQLDIKGTNQLSEVVEQLKVINQIVGQSELEANPVINIDLISESSINDVIDETDDDTILVADGDMFEGTRLQFRNCFFDNANNGVIIDWCAENGWKLSINGKEIID